MWELYHRLYYFTHKLKNPIIKPLRKYWREPGGGDLTSYLHHSGSTKLNMWVHTFQLKKVLFSLVFKKFFADVLHILCQLEHFGMYV